MTALELTCRTCGKKKMFTGKNIPEIMAAVDKAEWVDHPKADGDSCPDCAKAQR